MEEQNEIIVESERKIETRALDGKLTSGTFPPRKRGRPCNTNAARERSRVKTLRTAFLELQQTLPAVPPDTKLSKLDVLVLATTYISHLMRTLNEESLAGLPFTVQGFMHPVKKWPLRTRLYAEILSSTSADHTKVPRQPVTREYQFDTSTWRQ